MPITKVLDGFSNRRFFPEISNCCPYPTPNHYVQWLALTCCLFSRIYLPFLLPKADKRHYIHLVRWLILKQILAILVFGYCSVFDVYAANTPCSGRKGGISHCVGSTFVCNDGSTSASRQDCFAYMGGENTGADFKASGSTSEEAPASARCSCRSGTYCVGPRGGHYCYSDNGHKNYIKH